MFKIIALVNMRAACHITAACLLLSLSGAALAKGGRKSGSSTTTPATAAAAASAPTPAPAVTPEAAPASEPKTSPETSPEISPEAAAQAEIQSKLAEFDRYLEANQGPAAMNVFQSVKLKYPNDPQVRAYEAKILALQNKMLEAVPVLESLLKDHANHALGTALMANIEYRMGKKDEAKKRVDDALAVHADSWELLQISGEIKMADGQPILTLPIWRKIVENPSNPDVARMTGYAKLGVVYNGLGRYEEAAESLKQALDIKWHPSVGMGYIQALDQAKLYDKSFEAIADMRKHLAADNSPQFAQLRQQFEAQIGPIEARAKQTTVRGDLMKLDEEIASGKALYTEALGRIETLAKTIDKEVDPQTKATQQQQLRQTRLLAELMLLKHGLDKKYSLDWQKEAVGRIEKNSSGLQGTRVDDARKLVEQVTENIRKQTLTQRESLLDLANKGWMYKDFSTPNVAQLTVLKDRGLPERYDHFSADLRKTLTEYYTPLAEQREKLELETATGELLRNPTDKALKAKVAKLLTERVAQIDISKEGVTSFDVIPERVWTGPPGHNRAIDIDEKTNDLRDRAYSITSRLGTYKLTLNDRNEALIAGYSRALEVYPRQQTLSSRAEVYMYMGRYKEAWEDFAVSVAVAAWEEANSPRSASLMSGNWAVEGIPAVIIMDQIATGKLRKDGLYPATSVNAMLKGMQTKNWPAVTDLVMEKYDSKSFEARMLVDIRDGRHRDEILDVLADRYRKATAEEDKEVIKTRMDYLLSYHSHTAVYMLKAEQEKDPDVRLRYLRSAVFADPRSVKASFELAKQYEVVKQLDDAMLTYNIAAGGKLLTQTAGMAREAATARDRLSGPLANISEAVKVYEPHMDNINTLINERRANKLQASQYEALMTLFLNYNGNRKALIGRLADGLRAMHDYTQANEKLEEYAKLIPDRKGVALAMVAKNEMDLGLFDDALKTTNESIATGYVESWIYSQQGQLQTYLGKYEEAIASYTLAIQKKEDDTYSLTQRSELYEYFFDDYDKAIPDLEKALEIIKKKNPAADNFAMELRLNNLKMMKARKALGI